MFALFPASPVTSNIGQENNIQARKPIISNRKPLADIEIEKNVVSKPILHEKSSQKVSEVKEDLVFIDTCSYKEVKDTYNDTMGPENVNLICSILSDKINKTPLPKKYHFEPNLIENEYNIKYDFIVNDNSTDMIDILEIEDVPLPEFNFVF